MMPATSITVRMLSRRNPVAAPDRFCLNRGHEGLNLGVAAQLRAASLRCHPRGRGGGRACPGRPPACVSRRRWLAMGDVHREPRRSVRPWLACDPADRTRGSHAALAAISGNGALRRVHHVLGLPSAAGATTTRGEWGYSSDEPPHGDRFARLTFHTPTLTTTIDTTDNIARLWPIVDRLTAHHGVVTIGEVPVSRELGKGPGGPSQD